MAGRATGSPVDRVAVLSPVHANVPALGEATARCDVIADAVKP